MSSRAAGWGSELRYGTLVVLLQLLLACCTVCFVGASSQQASSVAEAGDPEAEVLAAAAAAAADPSTFQYGFYPPSRTKHPSYTRYCSCASPEPAVPGKPTRPYKSASTAAPDATASAAAAVDPSHYSGSTINHYWGGQNSKNNRNPSSRQCYKLLPSVAPGGMCGAAIGVCSPGYCCSQRGFCTRLASGCDGTCQCAYSGPGSKCLGQYPFALPNPLTLPMAARGGVCGPYIARCPHGQCCSQFMFCVDDGSFYCKTPSCHPSLSPGSNTCLLTHRTHNNSRVVTKDWVIAWKNLTLDGVERPVITLNGEFNTGMGGLFVNDRLIVKVVNQLQEPLSIHWHGILQFRTNTQDGVTAVTERPVLPGETVVYNFLLPNPGTFWWHSHFKTQYMDGLWGQMIIKDPSAYQFEVDTVVTVNDWYHQLSNVLLKEYLSPASQGDEPVPFDALLNGLGQGSCILDNTTDCTFNFTRAAASSCKNPKTRLRIINASGFARFNISIDNHRMILFSEDAVLIQPVELGSLTINVGQRYDVLPCQRVEDNGGKLNLEPVWIRATMIDSDFAYPSNYNTSLGVMYFTDEQPTQLPTTTADFQPPALDPSVPEGNGNINPYNLRIVGDVKPPPATKTLTYAIKFYNIPVGPNNTQYAHMNLISLDMTPTSPSLLERLTNNPANLPPPANPPPPGGKGWHVVQLEQGDVVDVIIQNLDTGEHPMHLHGHWFFIMGAGLPKAGLYKGQPLSATIARDTVTVNLKSYLVIRFMAANPGVWIFHCHIDWHLASGLGLIFQEGAFPRSHK